MINLNFRAVIDALGGDEAMFRIANAVRPPSRYLFNTILPERPRSTYNVSSGTLTVRTTMAGLTAMDSPYVPGGVVEMSTFLLQTAKLSVETALSENAQRELQQLVAQLRLGGGDDGAALAEEVLNFYEKVILQAHLDTAEWLRGQALAFGEIDWTFNQKQLAVNYGVPAAHLLTARTIAGGTAYSGASSSFWADSMEAMRLLRYQVAAVILSTRLLQDIISNPVNNIEVVAQDGANFTLRRLVSRGGNTLPTSDARETMRVVTYDEEAEVFDLNAPGGTIRVPFLDPTKMLFIGRATNEGYRVGQGSTDDPLNELELGYTHVAPTVEGGGRPGRWGRVYTPEQYPYKLMGQAVSNILPVLENPTKIVVATSELSS